MKFVAPVFLIAATVLCALSGFWVSRSAAAPGGKGLPGARPVIDAAQFNSLQAALDAVPAEGGLVLLPAGTFDINQPLIVRTDDTTLQGAGTATHIRNVNAQGQPGLVLELPKDAPKDKKNLWRIRLADFRLTGNPQSGHGIEARRINEVFIQAVTVSYHGGDGIRLDNCYEDPRVSDSLITYNKGTGLALLGCHDIVVSANQFEENQDAVHCLDGYNLCMTGNCVDDHLGHGVVIEDTYGSVVSGNMIEECHGTAVVLDRDCYGIAVSANVIAHNGGGVDLRDAHGCAVSANTFTIMVGDALRIGPASARISVTGNNFSNSFVGDEKVIRSEAQKMAGGVVLSGTSDVSLSGNVFAGLNPKPAVAVEGSPSRRVVFADNVLTGNSSQDDQLLDSVNANNVR